MPLPKFERQERRGRGHMFSAPDPGGDDTPRSRVGQGDTSGSVHVHQDAHNRGHTSSISDSASVSRAQVHPRTTGCKSSVVSGDSGSDGEVNEESSQYDSTGSEGLSRSPSSTSTSCSRKGRTKRGYGGSPRGSRYRRRSPTEDSGYQRRRSASPGSRTRSSYRRHLYRRSDQSRSRCRGRSRSRYPDRSRPRRRGRSHSCYPDRSRPRRRGRSRSRYPDRSRPHRRGRSRSRYPDRSRPRRRGRSRSRYPDHSRSRYRDYSRSRSHRRSRKPYSRSERSRSPHGRAQSPYSLDSDRRRDQQNWRGYSGNSNYRTGYTPRGSYGRRSDCGPHARGSTRGSVWGSTRGNAWDSTRDSVWCSAWGGAWGGARTSGYFMGDDREAQGGPSTGSHPRGLHPDQYLNDRSHELDSHQTRSKRKSKKRRLRRFRQRERNRNARRLSPYAEHETPRGDCQVGTVAQGSDDWGSEGGKGTPPPTQDTHTDRR